MSVHVFRRRRLVLLLAGLFSFIMTAALSVIPGYGITDVVRAGAAAATHSAGNRSTLPPAKAFDKDGRAQPTSADAADAEVWAAESPASQDETQDTAGHLPSGGSEFGPPRYELAALPRYDRAAPPAVPASGVQVRGPPFLTGS